MYAVLSIMQSCTVTPSSLVTSAKQAACLHAVQVHKAKLRRQKVTRKQRKRAAAYEVHQTDTVDVNSIAQVHDVSVSEIERINAGNAANCASHGYVSCL